MLCRIPPISCLKVRPGDADRRPRRRLDRRSRVSTVQIHRVQRFRWVLKLSLLHDIRGRLPTGPPTVNSAEVGESQNIPALTECCPGIIGPGSKPVLGVIDKQLDKGQTLHGPL